MKIKFKLAGISFALWLCFFSVTNNSWGQSPEKTEAPKWVVEDSWDVDVILYSRGWMLSFSDPKMEEEKLKPHVFARYTVKIEVTAELKCGDTDCWQLDFTANEKDKPHPNISGRKYRILVSKEDGSIKKILCLHGEKHLTARLEDVDGITVVCDAPYGFPLEIIPWRTNKVEGVKKTVLTASKNEAIIGNEKHKELIVRHGTSEPRIVQKWAEGAKWWSEYERYVSGHIELQAKLIGNTNDVLMSHQSTNELTTNYLGLAQTSTNNLTK